MAGFWCASQSPAGGSDADSQLQYCSGALGSLWVEVCFDPGLSGSSVQESGDRSP